MQPFGRFAHAQSGNSQPGVARTVGGGFHFDRNGQLSIVDFECFDRWFVERDIVSVGFEVGCRIAGYAVVRYGIGAVGRDVHFDDGVVLYAKIGFGRCADSRVGRQYHDAVVAGANAYFVLGAKHAERFDTAYFGTFDGETLVAGVEHCAYRCNDDFLSGSHVGRATHNLQRFACAYIYGGNVQMVGIFVRYASQHFAHHQAFEAAFDGLYRFY